MNKEINYSMVIDNDSSIEIFSTAIDKYIELRDNNEYVVLVVKGIYDYRAMVKQNGNDLSKFTLGIPDTISDETDLLTFIADKVELLMGTLFDEGTTFNLEALYYYND